jgi:tetratricopeptide (TPR) repeat protein
MKYTFLLLFSLSLTINGFGQTERDYLKSGLSKGSLEDYRGAITDFTKAIEIDSKNDDAYYNRGFSKSKLGDYRGAIADYTKAIEIDSKNDVAYYNRGIAKGSLEDYRGAIADFTKSIEILPRNQSYTLRGSAKSELEDYRGAITDFTKAIEIDSKNVTAYYYRGIAKIKLGQLDSGCLDLSKAGELGHDTAYRAIRDLCN